MKNNKKTNKEYLLENFDGNIPISFWVMYLDNFFGKERAEEFYEYLINAQNIKRKNDIRNLMSCIGFSIYELSRNEQLAFISIFKPLDTKSTLVTNMKNGTNTIFEYYKNKNIQLLKDIKKLGYSYEYAKFNWKDKKLKDTYQREYVLIVISETDDCEQFQKNLLEIAQKYNIKKILITDNMNDKSTKMQLKSIVINFEGKVEETIEDTTIDTIQNYLSSISKTKVLFKIPFENNKIVLNKDVNYLAMKNYYSKRKQEKVKNKNPYSFNSAMLKSALLHRFKDNDYNS